MASKRIQELNIENNGHQLRIRILGGFGVGPSEKISPECSTDGACAVADYDDSRQRKIKVKKKRSDGAWKLKSDAALSKWLGDD